MILSADLPEPIFGLPVSNRTADYQTSLSSVGTGTIENPANLGATSVRAVASGRTDQITLSSKTTNSGLIAANPDFSTGAIRFSFERTYAGSASTPGLVNVQETLIFAPSSQLDAKNIPVIQTRTGTIQISPLSPLSAAVQKGSLLLAGDGQIDPPESEAVPSVWNFRLDAALSGPSAALDALKPTIGDLNGDGSVDVRDVTLAIQAAVGLIVLQPDQQSIIDVNCDNKANVEDATLILQKVVGIEIQTGCE